MPVSLAVGDIASFRKYVKDIGRAYQKRSVAMIQLSRLFLEISPGKPDQIDALRSLFETVESALKSAVDAGKERSEAADTAFATAEEELDWYAAWHHPEEQSVLGDVQNIIEDAAQKDSRIMKTHKRLSTRLGLNKTGSPSSRSLVKVHFQILKSPTDRREAPVVTCELGPDVKISELLWTLSRLPEDQRISLKQNPHFYFSRDLSDQASAYDDQFKLEPLQDLRPEKDSVVLVLLDRAGQIFVDYEKFSKTYGNIWKPHDAIILKDLQGTLEAADRISPRVTSEVCIWQRGGGRPEEDLSKWTEVLDRALDFPDVDWLIRSETSPDEAFDIEVTGGWERCSPVPTPDPPRLFGPDNDTITVPLLEGPHVSAGEVPSLVSLDSSFVPTVGITSPQPSYPSLDTVRSDVTANLSSKEVPSDDENHRSLVEDNGSFTLNVPSLESTDEVEPVVHSPVHPTSISPGSSTPDVESQPTLAHSASPPERPALLTAKESRCSQDEEAPTQTLPAPAPTSSESPILSPNNIEPSPNSSVRPTLGNTPDDIHPRTQASQPPYQSARVLPESSTSLARSSLALASTACTPDNIPESAPPQAEVIHTTAHLGGSASRPLTPPFGCTPDPATVAPTRSRATSSNDTVLQVEAIHPPNAPEPPKPPTPGSSSPTLEHTAHAPDPTPVGTEIDYPTAARPIGRHISPTGSQQSLMGSVPAPHMTPPFSERVRSHVEVVRRPLAVKPPPAAPAEPSLLMGKNASPTGGRSVALSNSAAPHSFKAT
ncbi:hypothetical protein BC827DRAFT_112547 [Russula dissimulans]|nr:hypothetical protein BC827DRAFT_112547 [Russula dissimulans]